MKVAWNIAFVSKGVKKQFPKLKVIEKEEKQIREEIGEEKIGYDKGWS
jgi:hypothetical protein